jgi:hypothetical protein
MSDPNTTAGEIRTPTPRLRARRRSPSADCYRLWLAPADKIRLSTTATKLSALLGSRPSVSIILRAGVAALLADTDEALAEQAKRQPTGAGGCSAREGLIAWWLASAARSISEVGGSQ